MVYRLGIGAVWAVGRSRRSRRNMVGGIVDLKRRVVTIVVADVVVLR